MAETIFWDKAGIETRKAVCELAGWRTHKDKITKMGLTIARTNWNELSEVVQKILLRHGVQK